MAYTLSFSTTYSSQPAKNFTQHVYGVIAVPKEYQENNISIVVTVSHPSNSNYHLSSFGTRLLYKTTAKAETTLGFPDTNSAVINYTLDLTGALQLGFNLEIVYGINAYQAAGVNHSITFQLPWTSITSEDIITADKLIEASYKAFITPTITAGSTITLAPWQAVGTKQGVTFDTTKPLKSNLNAIIASFPENSFDAANGTAAGTAYANI